MQALHHLREAAQLVQGGEEYHLDVLVAAGEAEAREGDTEAATVFFSRASDSHPSVRLSVFILSFQHGSLLSYIQVCITIGVQIYAIVSSNLTCVPDVCTRLPSALRTLYSAPLYPSISPLYSLSLPIGASRSC